MEELDQPWAGTFGRNVAWLWGILDARAYPVDSFRLALELLTEEISALRPEDASRISTIVAGVTP